MKKARKLIEQGKLNEAESILQNETGTEALYLKGLIAFKQDRYDSAIALLQKAVEQDNSQARYHETLGQAYGLKAQHSGAVKGAMLLPKVKKSFQKALEIDPESLNAREGLFMFYLFSPGVAGGDEKKALEIANALLEQNPGHGHLLLALYAAKHQDNAAAENNFEKALELSADDAEIARRASRYFLETNNISRAKKAVERLRSICPDELMTLLALGDLARLKEDFETANSWYKKALAKNDAFFPARMKMAKNLAASGHKDEAAENYRYILEHQAKSPAAGMARQELNKL